METADYYYLQQNHQQQHQLSCGLTRYRSVPASLLENHVNGTTGVDAYGDFRSSSSSRPEMETFFMMSGNGSSDSGVSGCHDMQEYEEKSVKQEELMYQNQSLPLQTCSFGVVGTDVGLENSNLVRQSSSPAQFFSNQGLDNGFNGIRKMNTLRACNGINGEPTSTSRLYNNHISFSSGPSSYSKPMPQIARIETGADNGSLGNSNGSNGHFIPNLMSDSRHNPSLSSLKRARESNGDLFCGLSRSQTQNQDRRDSLTHQLSLPKTYEEDVVEKFWQFQGSTPCKIRAKRGFATHPRSIAERVRRTRISERMRKLQGLFPNIDKQTNTADMLDMAVEYIKDLQKQVKTLRDTKANCSC